MCTMLPGAVVGADLRAGLARGLDVAAGLLGAGLVRGLVRGLDVTAGLLVAATSALSLSSSSSLLQLLSSPTHHTVIRCSRVVFTVAIKQELS